MADIGAWSKRRHKINERVSNQQAKSVIVGYTDGLDDRRSLQQWTLILMGRLGTAAKVAEMLRDDVVPTDPDNAFENEIVALAGLCHSFLESIDRRRDEQ